MRLVGRGVGTAANLILISLGAVCLLTLMYFSYHYSWTKERRFYSAVGPVVYQWMPAMLALGFFLSLNLRATVRVNLALASMAFLVSLYLAELGLRTAEFVAYQWPSQIDADNGAARANMAARQGVPFDRRTKLEVIEAFRQQGIDAVPSLHPMFFWGRDSGLTQWSTEPADGRYFALNGIANKTTVLCNEGGEFAIYKSDEVGFHNPSGIWSQRQVEVVAIGDSFTHGACVPSDKNYVAMIRQHIPATLNLGIWGFGPLSELAVLKEYAIEVKPKKVLWFYFENDLSDLDTEKKNPILLKYLTRGFKQDLISQQSESDQVLRNYVAAMEREERARVQAARTNIWPARAQQLLDVVKLGFLRKRLGIVYDTADQNHSIRSEPDLALFRNVLTEARETVAAWGGSLHFVYLPQWERYGQKEKATPSGTTVLKLVQSMGIPIIDLNPVFQSHPDPLSLFPFRGFGHYNEAGHKVVADTVLEKLLHPDRPRVPAVATPTNRAAP